MNYSTVLSSVWILLILSPWLQAQENNALTQDTESYEIDSTDYKSAIIELLRNERSLTAILDAYMYLGIADSTYLNSIPSINPLQLNENPFVSSPYGFRFHPIKGIYLKHEGVDLVCKKGFQFIYATADGVVSKSGYNGGLGLSVTLKHPSGFETIYGHLSGIYVTLNSKVKIGSVIGVMGETGIATGIHLHYSIKRNGVFINPSAYLTLYQEFKQKRDALKATLNCGTSK